VVTGIAHLLRVLLVPSSSSDAGAVAAMVAGLSLLGTRGVEPSSKKAHTWSFLPVSSWYALGVGRLLTLLRFSYFCSDFKMWCHGDRCRTSSVPVVH
jgi:hypothetical protein